MFETSTKYRSSFAAGDSLGRTKVNTMYYVSTCNEIEVIDLTNVS